MLHRKLERGVDSLSQLMTRGNVRTNDDVHSLLAGVSYLHVDSVTQGCGTCQLEFLLMRGTPHTYGELSSASMRSAAGFGFTPVLGELFVIKAAARALLGVTPVLGELFKTFHSSSLRFGVIPVLGELFS